MIKAEELTNPESCMSRARDNEMTFVLLARDAAAPVAIRAWVHERVRLGKNALSDSQISEALACAEKMEETAAAMRVPVELCEACDEPAVTRSNDGVPLCKVCMDGLIADAAGI